MLVIGVAGLAVAVVALVTASVAVRSRRRLAARVEAVARQQAQLGTHLARLNERLLDLEEGRRSESGAERERARVRVELARTASGTHEVAHVNGDPLAWEPLPVRSLLAGARFGFAVDGHLDGPLDCVLRWHDGGGAHRVPVRLAAT